ncbi:MAG TPA: response regulator [Elusimicrobia bacterium]|jgi:CheY-like chemotaxis protein|nr:response regulator [Elusimicrobiota bacterium]
MGIKKILIVDDDDNFRNLLFMALAEDFDVAFATDGRRGLALIEEEKPDLIVCDVMMPNMSGLELLRELSADEDTRDIPVIVMTGSNFDVSTRQLFKQERNFRDFIEKMTPLNLIVERVKELTAGKA